MNVAKVYKIGYKIFVWNSMTSQKKNHLYNKNVVDHVCAIESAVHLPPVSSPYDL
jgi:predicted transcriptional regulator